MCYCNHCKSLIGPRETLHRVVTDYRDKVYDNDGFRSKGWEIAAEEIVCPPCHEGWVPITPTREVAATPAHTSSLYASSKVG
jgi:hypothetical protein